MLLHYILYFMFLCHYVKYMYIQGVFFILTKYILELLGPQLTYRFKLCLYLFLRSWEFFWLSSLWYPSYLSTQYNAIHFGIFLNEIRIIAICGWIFILIILLYFNLYHFVVILIIHLCSLFRHFLAAIIWSWNETASILRSNFSKSLIFSKKNSQDLMNK